MEWKVQTSEPERICMVKEFSEYMAWTDVRKEGSKFVGLIEYQRKIPGSLVNILWVLAPNITQSFDAEKAAIRMLSHIRDINTQGRIIYSDGIAL